MQGNCEKKCNEDHDKNNFNVDTYLVKCNGNASAP